MNNEKKETLKVRFVSISIVVLAIAIFKPFGLAVWQWEVYLHLAAFGLIGAISCLVSELILAYLLRLPISSQRGVEYIIRRNLWFQIINTLLVSLLLCLYRHWAMSNNTVDNQLSWGNFFETLIIIAFCSYLLGLYWRFKFRNRYLTAELEETRMMNEQLQKMQQMNNETAVQKTINTSPTPDYETTITLVGSTKDKVSLKVSDLLYLESVGNYVKVCHLCNKEVRTDMIRSTLLQIEEVLHEYQLIARCHRAFLVNLGQVAQIVNTNSSMQLIVKHCHDSLPVSRSNMSQIKNTFKSL